MAMTDITSKAPPTGQPGQRGQIVTIGQAVGQAEAVLTRLLARVLAETRTSRQDYLALQRLAALGGVASREEYITDLSGALYIDLWSAVSSSTRSPRPACWRPAAGLSGSRCPARSCATTSRALRRRSPGR
jgi:hypothetical protein